MAQTGVVTLQLFDFPKGSDKIQHTLILEGQLVIGTSSTANIAITAWSITSNVLTLTAANSLTTGGGDSITVSGFTTSTFLNGIYTTSSATSTTIVVPLTHANGSGTEAGIAVLTPQYITGGLPITYAFTNSQGATVVPPLGSGAVPKWIQAVSKSGGAFNYKFDQTVTPNTLRIYSGITEVTTATNITPDTIVYRAEFAYDIGSNGY